MLGHDRRSNGKISNLMNDGLRIRAVNRALDGTRAMLALCRKVLDNRRDLIGPRNLTVRS